MNYDLIIQHCAPTLAGIKTGSLYNLTFDDFDAFLTELEAFNTKFAYKDLHIRFLRLLGERALIYVYRKHKLQEILDQEDVENFLRSFGYSSFQVDACLRFLTQKFCTSTVFPHEIGIFLGYPLEDVLSFIEENGKHCKLCGCWKVYHQVEKAKEIFDLYKKCERICRQRYQLGMDLDCLVADPLSPAAYVFERDESF